MSDELPITENQEPAASIPPPPSPKRLRIVRLLTAIAIPAALGAAFFFREHLQNLKQYGYAAVFLVGLVSNATLIFPIPGLAISSVMGGLFNPWLVGLFGGTGQALGELTGYMAGYSGQTWLSDHPAYKRLTHRMQRYGVLAIFILALLPNPFFDVAGVAAGALRFPVWKFLVSCAMGKISKNIIFALVGYYGIGAVFRLLNPLVP